MMEQVETRVSPCEDCHHTGRCAECRGTGRVGGEACDCDDGKCIVCEGTGKVAEFYYKGRPIPDSFRDWWRPFSYGVGLFVCAVLIVVLSWFKPNVPHPQVEAIEFGIVLAAVGVAIMAWSLRRRKLRTMKWHAWWALRTKP